MTWSLIKYSLFALFCSMVLSKIISIVTWKFSVRTSFVQNTISLMDVSKVIRNLVIFEVGIQLVPVIIDFSNIVMSNIIVGLVSIVLEVAILLLLIKKDILKRVNQEASEIINF